MNSEESKDKKAIRGGRNLVILGISAIVIALITTSVSLYFYSKGDIYIDRSRPGYISEGEVRQTDDDYQEKYSDEGEITEESLAEYLEELGRVTERIEDSQNDFGPNPLSDEGLMIVVEGDED